MPVTPSILLATDLDRTVLPNGAEPASPDALPFFRTIAARPEITLSYVSGRDKSLLQSAIAEYALPAPAYAIGDVGTTIYDVADGWKPLEEWAAAIAPDWNGHSADDIRALLRPFVELTEQEASKQNTFKVSYYAKPSLDRDELLKCIEAVLKPAGIRASLIWSIDEPKNTGLLDVLPASATKIHALQFLRLRLGFAEADTVFCGDSGNDLPALTSGLNAVLVRNASPEVREETKRILASQGMDGRLYEAEGDFLGLNGNYAAGVLEGLAHFFPETREWMRA